MPLNQWTAFNKTRFFLYLEIPKSNRRDKKNTIICSKIVLNPENSVDIKEPTKGKVVNQSEFDEIMDKKL